MRVFIKKFEVLMEVKNNGIEFDVNGSDGGHTGDLVLTKTKLVWCPGKVDRKNGIPISWVEFIQFMEARRRA